MAIDPTSIDTTVVPDYVYMTAKFIAGVCLIAAIAKWGESIASFVWKKLTGKISSTNKKNNSPDMVDKLMQRVDSLELLVASLQQELSEYRHERTSLIASLAIAEATVRTLYERHDMVLEMARDRECIKYAEVKMILGKKITDNNETNFGTSLVEEYERQSLKKAKNDTAH